VLSFTRLELEKPHSRSIGALKHWDVVGLRSFVTIREMDKLLER
jgi:hypothetical protein